MKNVMFGGYCAQEVLFIRILLCLILLLVVYMLVSPKRHRYMEIIYQKRFFIALGLIFAGVLLNLNGSSLAAWNEYVPGVEGNTVFGEPRLVRSDEWATFTPMAISQSYGEDSYSWFSQIIRGTSTDTFVVYAQPVKNIFGILFRPFLSGYLVLGVSRGVSFFWCARIVVLWLVYFELTMLLTGDRKGLSVMGATLTAFAPIVQWWFAINGLVEMLIFGGLAVLMLDCYMRTGSKKKRGLCLGVLYICAGGYIMTFYPASMIPLAYLFGGIAVWVILKNRKETKIDKIDLCFILIVFFVFCISMFWIFSKSQQTIASVLNTAYPGNRESNGGGYLKAFFMSWGNVFFPVSQGGVPNNVCESAFVFSAFPMGILLSAAGMIREKKIDSLNFIFLIVGGFISIYCIWGFPAVISKISLMSMSTANRAIIVPGLCNVFLLVRSLAIYEWDLRRKHAVVLTILGCFFVVFTERWAYGAYMESKKTVCLACVCAVVFYSLWRIRKYGVWTIGMISALVFVTGIAVNPIQYGLAGVLDSEVAQAVRTISENDREKIWVSEGVEYPVMNYLIMQGASTLNSTNVYPNLELWERLDTDGLYSDIYNRYAHISVQVIDENAKDYEQFVLESPDYFTVNVTLEQLKETLGVTYIFSPRELEQYSSEAVRCKKVDSVGGYSIYQLD